ncbi:MAG TPA: hypothetical protein VGA36_02780 [Nitriliruptorales bacterium]
MNDDPTTDPADTVEPGRMRRARRVVAGGAGLGLVAAIVTAVAGGSGATSVFLVLLLAAAAAGIAATDAAVLMVVDQYRGHPSTWRRLVLVMGLLAAAFVLLAMLGAVGASGS